MPPFVNTICPFCSKPNRYDLLELRKLNGSLMKAGVSQSESQNVEEFKVTCRICGGNFKFTEKGTDDATKK
ncbi:MAG: hypothetical protein WCK35_23290 [Chloroflexota bacterium]